MQEKKKFSDNNFFLFLLVLFFLLGSALRLYFFAGGNFPIHDGGFFYVLVKDLITNKFHLPEYSTFNNANIPFIYPPLGIYIIGMIETITKVDRLYLFRFIPMIITILTILSFYFLALQINRNKWEALASTTAFSVLPMSFTWLILGGGVTRAFGAFFGTIAITFAINFIKSGEWKIGILASIFCGLSVLSHPEWAWFLFYSLGLFCIINLKNNPRVNLLRSFLLFLGTSVIILPWIVTILRLHGRSAFLPLLDNGFSRLNDVINFIFLNWSRELSFPVFTLLATVGIVNSIIRKEWFIVLWLPLIFFLQGRAADQKAIIPLSLLAGVGAKKIFELLIARFPKKYHVRILTLTISGIYIYSLICSILFFTNSFTPISNKFLKGIDWIKQESPARSKFLVMTGTEWTQDKYSEWINALSGRESISDVQGYEWLPDFNKRISRYNQLQYEYSNGMIDLVSWIAQNNIHIDYIIFPKENIIELNNRFNEPSHHLNDARNYPGVKVVFENDGILILDISTLFNY
jgi:hypothetical protein